MTTKQGVLKIFRLRGCGRPTLEPDSGNSDVGMFIWQVHLPYKLYALFLPTWLGRFFVCQKN